MVRRKSRGKKPKPPSEIVEISSGSSQGSSNSVNQPSPPLDLDWCLMAKKRKSTKKVISQLFVNDRGPGQACMSPEGYWVDSKYWFVRKYDVDEKLFYSDLSFQY